MLFIFADRGLADSLVDGLTDGGDDGIVDVLPEEGPDDRLHHRMQSRSPKTFFLSFHQTRSSENFKDFFH